MASVSPVQSSDYAQQMREAERLRATQQAPQQTQQQATQAPPPPPAPRNANLGSNLDVTA